MENGIGLGSRHSKADLDFADDLLAIFRRGNFPQSTGIREVSHNPGQSAAFRWDCDCGLPRLLAAVRGRSQFFLPSCLRHRAGSGAGAGAAAASEVLNESMALMMRGPVAQPCCLPRPSISIFCVCTHLHLLLYVTLYFFIAFFSSSTSTSDCNGYPGKAGDDGTVRRRGSWMRSLLPSLSVLLWIKVIARTLTAAAGLGLCVSLAPESRLTRRVLRYLSLIALFQLLFFFAKYHITGSLSIPLRFFPFNADPASSPTVTLTPRSSPAPLIDDKSYTDGWRGATPFLPPAPTRPAWIQVVRSLASTLLRGAQALLHALTSASSAPLEPQPARPENFFLEALPTQPPMLQHFRESLAQALPKSISQSFSQSFSRSFFQKFFGNFFESPIQAMSSAFLPAPESPEIGADSAEAGFARACRKRLRSFFLRLFWSLPVHDIFLLTAVLSLIAIHGLRLGRGPRWLLGCLSPLHQRLMHRLRRRLLRPVSKTVVTRPQAPVLGGSNDARLAGVPDEQIQEANDAAYETQDESADAETESFLTPKILQPNAWGNENVPKVAQAESGSEDMCHNPAGNRTQAAVSLNLSFSYWPLSTLIARRYTKKRLRRFTAWLKKRFLLDVKISLKHYSRTQEHPLARGTAKPKASQDRVDIRLDIERSGGVIAGFGSVVSEANDNVFEIGPQTNIPQLQRICQEKFRPQFYVQIRKKSGQIFTRYWRYDVVLHCIHTSISSIITAPHASTFFLSFVSSYAGARLLDVRRGARVLSPLDRSDAWNLNSHPYDLQPLSGTTSGSVVHILPDSRFGSKETDIILESLFLHRQASAHVSSFGKQSDQAAAPDRLFALEKGSTHPSQGAPSPVVLHTFLPHAGGRIGGPKTMCVNSNHGTTASLVVKSSPSQRHVIVAFGNAAFGPLFDPLVEALREKSAQVKVNLVCPSDDVSSSLGFSVYRHFHVYGNGGLLMDFDKQRVTLPWYLILD